MQNRNFKTRALTEASISAAIILIIYLANTYIPLFVYVGTFLLPTVISLMYLRHDFKTALGTVVTSGVLISILVSPTGGITFPIIIGAIGLTLGYCLKNKKKFSKTIIYLSISFLIGILVGFTFYILIFYNGDISKLVNETVSIFNTSTKTLIDMYANAGVPQEQLQLYKSNVENMMAIMKYIIPSMLIMSSTVNALLCYVFSRMILKRFKYEVPPVPSFTKLYITNRVGTILCFMLIIGILMGRKNVLPNTGLSNTIYYSSQSLLQTLLALDGAALAAYYFKNKFSLSNKMIVFVLILSVFPLQMVYAFAGLADMVFDFRKLDPFKRNKIE